MPSYSIGELAAAAGVRVSTIRYYERQGLLVPDGRTESNYRVYGRRSLDRLKLVLAAKAGGLALGDVKRLLALRERSGSPCPDVQEVLERRLAEVERRIAQLRRERSALRASLAACRESAPSGACRTLDELERAALGARPRAGPERRAKGPGNRER